MKLRETFFILIILFACLNICLGQENPKAELVDEFSALYCDELKLRIEGLLSQIAGSSNSKGYVYITGKDDDLRKKVFRELLIKGQIELRNFDKDRIVFVRGTNTDNLSTQLWKVPVNAEKPELKEAKWNFVFPPQTRPFIFTDDASDGVCPDTPFETVYAEYLNANPQARGHIFIYTKSLKKYNNFKKNARSLLKDIPISRLRFFHVKKAHSVNYANVEYWLVPRNAK